jgi:hypothetical protein
MRQVRQDDPRWQWAHFRAAPAGRVSRLAKAIHRTIPSPVARASGLAWLLPLPSPPGCNQAGWRPFAAVGFACRQATERNGSSARQRSQIRLTPT